MISIAPYVRSHRFHDDQDHHGHQDQGRKLIEPAVKNMSVPVAVMPEIGQQFPAVDMESDENRDQHQLDVEPQPVKPV